ncbi:MAG TPA: hopanoid biosynthesis-associated protein HpnK [Candidatus Binataceae bacterium]|nr:hopanoid biosynthesis-associated protein HpnK [Candidatus Binataceae bacterium]
MADGQAIALGAHANRSSSSDKFLIVNADDFGLSPEVNAAVVRCHREGILTATSLMVAAPAAAEASRIASETPTLDVGLHAVVCMGRSVMGPRELAGLVDKDGNFTNNAVAAGFRYFFARKIHAALRAVLRAQVERHLELVGRLDHIDGHLNFHVHPVLADILIDLAAEHHVPFIRLPREPVITTLRLARDNAPRKLVEGVIFRALSRRARRKARERGIRTNDWLFGLHQSGNMSETYVLGVIERLRSGVTEMYFHPAMDIGGVPPSPAAQREVEILTGPRVREALAKRDVRLTTFAALAKS